MKTLVVFFFTLFFTLNIFSQGKKVRTKTEKDTIFKNDLINPLAPAKAAFYSAVLPGLGQAYNKKYWKIPIVYGALGTSTYFYFKNNSDLKQYRRAYKSRLAGKTDEFLGLISDQGLVNAQKTLKKNRDLSMFLTIAFYALNIIEANVDAHITDIPIDNKVTFKPSINYSPDLSKPVFGLSTTIILN
jgi:uncharacterized protein DUF5683